MLIHKIKAVCRCGHASVFQVGSRALFPACCIQILLLKQVQFEITGRGLFLQYPKEQVLQFVTYECLSATLSWRNQEFYLPSPPTNQGKKPQKTTTLLCPGSMALVTVVRSLDLCYPTWLLRMCLFDMWLIQIEIFCWYKGEKISKSQCKKYNVE